MQNIERRNSFFNNNSPYISKDYPKNYQKNSSKYNKKDSLHYLTNEKPWNYRSYGGPFLSEWEKYRRKSLWRDCRNIKPLKKHVKHLVKRYLFPDMFGRQHNGWAVLPDTQQFYK